MFTNNYFQGIDCVHNATNEIDGYRKGHRSGKRKFMKAYIYTNQL